MHFPTSTAASSVTRRSGFRRLSRASLGLLALVLLAGLPLAAESPASLAPPAAGPWQELSTAHFRFVFRDRDRSFVDRLVAVSDDVYRTVSGLFAWASPEVVPVVIRGDQDSGAVGGLTSTFPLRIELVACQMDAKVLLQHEYTHYINATRHHGLIWFVSQFFGSDLSFLGVSLQLHSLEGVTSFIDGERGSVWNEMLYRAPVIEGRMWGETDIWKGGSFRPGALRVYVSQYLFCDWLYRHFGPDVFSRIHDRYSLFTWAGDFEAIKFVTGMETERIWAAVIQELENRYAADRSLSSGIPVSTQSSFRQEGDTLLGATNRGFLVKRTSIYQTAALGFWIPPREDPPVTGPRLDQPLQSGEWFPLQGMSGATLGAAADRSGLTVVVALPEAAGDQDLNRSLVSDLWRLEPQPAADGKSWQANPRRLTRGMSLSNPVLSADGKRLFAIQRLSADYRLVEVDPQLGLVSLVLDLRRPEGDPVKGLNVTEASISPDGSQLALLVANGGGNDLATIPVPPPGQAADPAALRWITADAAHEYSPHWLADGRLVFGSDRENHIWLYRADAAGKISGLLRDPVGVWAGDYEASVYQRPNGTLTDLPELGRFLYQSYSSDGPTIKRLAADRLEQRAIEGMDWVAPDWLGRQKEREKSLQAISPAPGPSPEGPVAADATSHAYADLALPRYWLPAFSADTDAWGAGVSVFGHSLLGIQNWSAQVKYIASGLDPASAKPQMAGDFTYQLKLPDFSAQLGFSQDQPAWDPLADNAIGWSQRRGIRLGLNANLLTGSSPDGLAGRLSAKAAAQSVWTVAKARPFDLVEAWQAAPDWTLNVTAGLVASLDWPRATAAFMGGQRLWAALDGFSQDIGSGNPDWALRLALGAGIAIDQSVLRLQARAAWSQTGHSARFLDNLAGAGWRIPDGPWRGDLQIAFDLPDPLLPGNRLNWLIPMEKTGTTLLVQSGAVVDAQGKPAWDESIQLGLATSFVPFLYYQELPLGAGAALRLNMADVSEGQVLRSANLRFWVGLNGQIFSW